jgi:hypothetical protein
MFIYTFFSVYYERLQDKLVQVKDTRAALDAMREDHRVSLQQEAAFAEQQRQIQLAMKLDVLRQRKQQYQQVIFLILINYVSVLLFNLLFYSINTK